MSNTTTAASGRSINTLSATAAMAASLAFGSVPPAEALMPPPVGEHAPAQSRRGLLSDRPITARPVPVDNSH
jgi:hypothetical protein